MLVKIEKNFIMYINCDPGMENIDNGVRDLSQRFFQDLWASPNFYNIRTRQKISGCLREVDSEEIKRCSTSHTNWYTQNSSSQELIMVESIRNQRDIETS